MIPNADELFSLYFDRWYDEQWREWKGFPLTRPDILTNDGLKGVRASDVSPLDSDDQNEVREMIARIHDAAISDWMNELSLQTPVDTGWIRTIDQHYDRNKIRLLIDESSPDDFSNAYLVTCCEFGALLGHVLRDQIPELEWLYAWPYWESSLIYPPIGAVIPSFHWAIKKMSEYGVDDGFAEKINACCQLLAETAA